MIPYNHFWSVFSERNKIEPKFSSAIDKSRKIFDNFDRYSKTRISTYTEMLTSIVANKSTNKSAYLQAGFTGINDDMVKENYITALRLQLQSQNTDSLRSTALSWIDHASKGASVWNAFLVGNIDKISAAIEGWNQQLYEVSIPKLSNEVHAVLPFDPNKDSYRAANNELISLRDLFKNSNNLSIYTFVTGIFLFVMLLFPYILQKRNTRATGLYYLIPRSSGKRTKTCKTNYQEDKTNKTDETNENFSNDDIYKGTF